MMGPLWVISQDAFWSAIAAMGFAMLFNVPRRALPYCIAGGAIGHAARALLVIQLGISIELATLVGATLVGFWAHGWAQRLKMPAMIFAVSAAIPMVPGVFAYQTMIGLLQMTTTPPSEAGSVLVAASITAIKTGLILAAIAVGIVAPTLLFHRHRPVV